MSGILGPKVFAASLLVGTMACDPPPSTATTTTLTGTVSDERFTKGRRERYSFALEIPDGERKAIEVERSCDPPGLNARCDRLESLEVLLIPGDTVEIEVAKDSVSGQIIRVMSDEIKLVQ